MKILKIAFLIIYVCLLLVLVAATFIEKLYGVDCSHRIVYGSVWFVILWFLLAVLSIIIMVRMGQYRFPGLVMLHLSFVVILIGALLTNLYGFRGRIMLSEGESCASFSSDRGWLCQLPFRVRLDRFEVVCYPGTDTPMDYCSHLSVFSGEGNLQTTVRMNHIFSYHHYRFYQTSYSPEGKTSTLSVTCDPYGIAVTYAGYGLLWLSLFLVLLGHKSDWHLWRNRLKYAARFALFAAFLSLPLGASASCPSSLRSVSPEVAASIGNLYVFYNGRICPLQTLAKDFAVSLYGRPAHQLYGAEQVLAGWLYYPEDWSRDLPLDPNNPKQAQKLALVRSLLSGQMLKLFPSGFSRGKTGRTRLSAGECGRWYAQGDALPRGLPASEWLMIRKSPDYLYQEIAQGHEQRALYVLAKMRKYQERMAGTCLPSPLRFQAEKMYNRMTFTCPLSLLCLLAGLLSYIVYLCRTVHGKSYPRTVQLMLRMLRGLVLAYLTVALVLRGYVSGHVPLTNGYELMEALAWTLLLLTYWMRRRNALVMPVSVLLAGFMLLVALMGESDPPITPLLPVLSSPLLSFHVAIIMVSYALFSIIAIHGVTGLILHVGRQQTDAAVLRLFVLSHLLLYPAVCCLAAGIFIGAVWANQSWGQYWSWDPKETWALITFLIYALLLHRHLFPRLDRPLFFHALTVIAFLSVLITYFGVNFLLGGMHSYAG